MFDVRLEIIDGDEGQNDGDRKSDYGDQRAAHVEKKNDDDDADDETLLDQFFFQSRDRSEYEIRSVVGADDLYAGRESRLDLFDFLLDAIDQD